MSSDEGYDYTPQPSRGRSDHERVVTSGAWAATFLVSLALMWADAKMPYLAAWLLNTTVLVGVSCGMARWKRAWYAWLAFWVIAVICALEGTLKAVDA